jgi:hypothetical protein
MEINDKMDGVVKKDGKLRAFSSDNVYLAPSLPPRTAGKKWANCREKFRQPRFRRWVARKVRSRQSAQSA